MALSGADIQQMALSLPGSEKKSHFEKDDFRVENKIFATMPEPDIAVLKLLPDQQALLLETQQDTFEAVKGSWGQKGWTRVHLANISRAEMITSLELAWRNIAPKKLLNELDKERSS